MGSIEYFISPHSVDPIRLTTHTQGWHAVSSRRGDTSRSKNLLSNTRSQAFAVQGLRHRPYLNATSRATGWWVYSQSGRSIPQGNEPPGANPHAGWCGTSLGAIRIPISI